MIIKIFLVVEGFRVVLAYLILDCCLLSSWLSGAGLFMRSQIIFGIESLVAVFAENPLRWIMGFSMLSEPSLTGKYPLTGVADHLGTLLMDLFMSLVCRIVTKILLTGSAFVGSRIHMFRPDVSLQCLCG